MPHFRTWDSTYYDFHTAEDEPFDFSNVGIDDDSGGVYDQTQLFVWRDSTLENSDEPGLDGVTIYLDLNDNEPDTTTTFEGDFII